MSRLAVALLALLLAFPAVASDKAKEKRWAEQVVDALLDGEAEWLDAGGDRFLAILTEPEGTPRGTAILLHGIGVHPDWPQVIHPLRTGLAERGWTTLSLQLPILPNDADGSEYLPLYPEVAPRIDAALALLAERDALPTALVAHSMGASMGAWYLRGAQPGGAVSGLLGIGMSGRSDGGVADVATSLTQIGLPVLDLYGEHDLEPVLAGVERRFAAGSRSPGYVQKRVPGVDHFFDGAEETLVDLVDAWLAERTPR